MARINRISYTIKVQHCVGSYWAVARFLDCGGNQAAVTVRGAQNGCIQHSGGGAGASPRRFFLFKGGLSR